MPITEATDIHAVCDVIKSWFRVLPDPVFPSSLYHEVIEVISLSFFFLEMRSTQLMSCPEIEEPESRLTGIRNIIRRIPQANFDLLRRATEHLDRVTDFEESNQMTAEALAIVFSPNLLRAPHNDFAVIMANMGHMHKLVKTLITHVSFMSSIALALYIDHMPSSMSFSMILRSLKGPLTKTMGLMARARRMRKKTRRWRQTQRITMTNSTPLRSSRSMYPGSQNCHRRWTLTQLQKRKKSLS